jgi:hypothetical protein
MMDDCLTDYGTELRHTRREPQQRMVAVQRQVGASRRLCHGTTEDDARI